jgi:hypothetical protein
MLNWKRQKIEEPQFIEVGDLVREVETGAVGTLRTVSVSPYYVEEKAGVVRGYVVFEGSADWMLSEEIELVAKAAALRATAIA